MDEQPRGTWSGPWAFILAAAGSAVGLGNIWKFPFITGVNGGGAFVLVYLVFIALIGLPLLAGEMLVGRRARREAVGAYRALAEESGASRAWSGFGALAVIGSFALLSYYSVVGGWTLAYLVKALGGSFTADRVRDIPALFATFTGTHAAVIAAHATFMILVIAIVLAGVRHGIERASKLMMPALAVLLLILLGRALMMDGAGQALRFMFSPDFSKLTRAGVLEALGHAFFTLSLGMGAMIAYGSYLGRDESIVRSALVVVVFDTAIALIAGVMIFGIVFSFGLEPGAGPSLIFETMPVLFAQLPAGSVFATLFFVLLAFAALTSAISILEVPVAYCVDQRAWPRVTATLLIGGLAFVAGIASALSSTVFGRLDYLVSNWGLPIGGLGIALFTGWVMRREHVADELGRDPLGARLVSPWRLCTRWLAPLAILIVGLHGLGVL